MLWRGDPAVWHGTAPILFPVVGRLRGGGFYYRGRFYQLPIHGFAADSAFSIDSHSPTAVTLRLEDNEITRAMFPFAFILRVRFEICDSELLVEYQVQNPADESLIFSLGSHPAFALPAPSMGTANAAVCFDRVEEGICHRIRDRLLGPAEKLDMAAQKLVLDSNSFDEDAIILRNLRSRYLTLYARGERLLTLDTGGAPHLGLWAKPDAPYLCIEPWLTTDDDSETPLEIEAKPGFVTLPGGEHFHMSYRIAL